MIRLVNRWWGWDLLSDSCPSCLQCAASPHYAQDFKGQWNWRMAGTENLKTTICCPAGMVIPVIRKPYTHTAESVWHGEKSFRAVHESGGGITLGQMRLTPRDYGSCQSGALSKRASGNDDLIFNHALISLLRQLTAIVLHWLEKVAIPRHRRWKRLQFALGSQPGTIFSVWCRQCSAA